VRSVICEDMKQILAAGGLVRHADEQQRGAGVGRRPRQAKEEAMSQRCTVRLPDTLYEYLQIEADARQCGVSDLIREGLERLLGVEADNSAKSTKASEPAPPVHAPAARLRPNGPGSAAARGAHAHRGNGQPPQHVGAAHPSVVAHRPALAQRLGSPAGSSGGAARRGSSIGRTDSEDIPARHRRNSCRSKPSSSWGPSAMEITPRSQCRLKQMRSTIVFPSRDPSTARYSPSYVPSTGMHVSCAVCAPSAPAQCQPSMAPGPVAGPVSAP
jgi:hypothetical protein